MGKRGPVPMPTSVLKMRGSWLAKLRPGEPTPELGVPPRPEFASEDAGKAWDYLVPLLENSAMLALVDANSLERYCILFAQWREVTKKVQQFGIVIAKKKGDTIVGMEQSEYFHAQIKLGKELLRLEIEFGLTPAARARIATAPQENHKPTGKERFFA